MVSGISDVWCVDVSYFSFQISAQVKKELQVLLYGSEQKDMKLPGSLVQWLSTQFVSNSDLLASLGALEKRILGNLSLQMEEMQLKPSEETITQSVRQATEQSGLSEEVKVSQMELHEFNFFLFR